MFFLVLWVVLAGLVGYIDWCWRLIWFVLWFVLVGVVI